MPPVSERATVAVAFTDTQRSAATHDRARCKRARACSRASHCLRRGLCRRPRRRPARSWMWLRCCAFDEFLFCFPLCSCRPRISRLEGFTSCSRELATRDVKITIHLAPVFTARSGRVGIPRWRLRPISGRKALQGHVCERARATEIRCVQCRSDHTPGLFGKQRRACHLIPITAAL
jgi:hypothetical protein